MIEQQQYRVVMREQFKTIERLERRISELREENAEMAERLAVLAPKPDLRTGDVELSGESGQKG